MSEQRISIEDIAAVRHNLNRRLAAHDVVIVTEQRNGRMAVDEGRISDGAIVRHLYSGTKREVYEHLWAMIRGIDLVTR